MTPDFGRHYDAKLSSSCALLYKGAWWYNDWHTSNLNAIYHHGPHSFYADGVNWEAWKWYLILPSRVRMRDETRKRLRKLGFNHALILSGLSLLYTY